MSVLLLVGMFLTGGVVLVILMDQHENALREYAVLGLFCSILIMLAYYVELNTPGFAAKIDAVKFGYVGKVFVNPMLVMLVMRYYNVRVGRLWQAMLYLIPVVTIYLVFTCERHTLYYADMRMDAEGLIRVEPGVFYYVYIGYNTLLAMIHLAFCLYERAGLHGREKANSNLLIAACLLPFLALLTYLSGWTGGLDTSPIGVMAGSLCIAFSIFRYGLLNKDDMLQSMATGLIFLDSENRLIYANRAATRIFPVLSNAHTAAKQDLSPLCTAELAAVQRDGATYQRRITEWSSGDGQHGKLLTYDDVTEIRARLSRDGMTGLLNHATFYPMLDDAMSDANNGGPNVSVSIADIDSFKHINDEYGHANGDTVLIELARILQEICGPHGDVFRYGGEEFAVIFRMPLSKAEEVMAQALAEFSAIEFDFLDRPVTFSFGTAEFNATESSVALFDRADQLMYQRKRALHKREREAAGAQ